ncbi:MAG: DUF4375 domain-containing protein [Flavobacteriales bacterium]
MTYIQIILLILLTTSCLIAVIVTIITPQTSKKKKEIDVILNKKIYNKTSYKNKSDLIVLFVQELRLKEEFNEEAFFKIPLLLQIFYLVEGFNDNMNYDNFLEFLIGSSEELINKTLISLEKVEAIKAKESLVKAIEILKSHGETIETIQEKEGYTIHDIIVEPDLDRNYKLIEELEELDILYHQQKENLIELNLAYFDKHKDELWEELK